MMTQRNFNAIVVAGLVATAGFAMPAHAGDVDSFTISLEEEVSDGVPGAGAGNLETPTSMDVYTVNIVAGTEVFFHELAGPCHVRWTLEDPNGDPIFSSDALCSGNPGTYELTLGGDYTISVFSSSGSSGTYSFILWEVNPPETFAITAESVVSDGVPGVGAGNLEEPGAVDFYTFEAKAGNDVYFAEDSGACNIRWNLFDPNGDAIFTDDGLCSGDPGTIEMTLSGTYTIRVDSTNSGSVGTYGFSLNIVDAAEMFAITTDSVVSDGVPGPGAGNLEEPGALDVYTFSTTAGTNVFFKEDSGGCSIRWNLYDPNGDALFTNDGLCSGNPGTIELAMTGMYTIEVSSNESGATGTYGFALNVVDSPQTFAINLEDAVSDGVPGAGAGNIEEPGAIDCYTFSVAPGTAVFFEELAGSCNHRWSVVDANSDVIFANNGLCSGNPGTIELTLGGTYTVEVSTTNSGATGTYSFVIWEVNPAEEFTISLDEIIEDGVPGVGAGNIEEAGAIDRYFLDLPADSIVCFEEFDGACNIRWSAFDPNGDELFAENGVCSGDPGTFELSLAGTYVIEVSSTNSGATGTYSVVVNTGKLADFDGNCHVDVNDLLVLLAAWGTPDADVDGDDDTSIGDLLILLGEWG